VQAGEALAVISPASGLVAEVYVTPRDVGLIRVGAPVRMLIDAFNYTDWGVVTGRVVEVSGDFVQVGGQPMFKVKCSMDRDWLSLRNGFTGHLRKGMTLRARFVVAERSLFQLLFDDVNDWLNPAQAPLPVAAATGAPADAR
jgi:HlyD family secretion protein